MKKKKNILLNNDFILAMAIVLAMIVGAFAYNQAQLSKQLKKEMVALNSVESEETLIGIFSGTLPCADCPGIKTDLALLRNKDNANEGEYLMISEYLERDVKPYAKTGTWHGKEINGVYMYVLNEAGTDYYYAKLNEDQVEVRGEAGEKIETEDENLAKMFILTKNNQ